MQNETLRSTIIAAVVAIMIDANESADYAVGTYLYGSKSTAAEQEYIAALDHEGGFEYGLFLADIRRAYEAATARQPIGMTLTCSCGECTDCLAAAAADEHDKEAMQSFGNAGNEHAHTMHDFAMELDDCYARKRPCTCDSNPELTCLCGWCYECTWHSTASYSVHKTFYGEC